MSQKVCTLENSKHQEKSTEWLIVERLKYFMNTESIGKFDFYKISWLRLLEGERLCAMLHVRRLLMI